MNYTYKKTTTEESIIRKEDNAFIPKDEANTDYQEYLEWAKTNTAESAD
tara:strand:+ start:393 stop:539 length:147 start_codon:yes stop_codon:yes gene_type:complete